MDLGSGGRRLLYGDKEIRVNNVLKLALIGGGAYLLFKDQLAYFFGGAQSALPAPSGQPAATQPPAASAPATTAPAAPSLKEEILRRSAGDPAIVNGLASSHVWGYYWAQVKGTPAPSPDRIGFSDGNALITLDTYLAGYSHGLSGMRAARRAWRYR